MPFDPPSYLVSQASQAPSTSKIGLADRKVAMRESRNVTQWIVAAAAHVTGLLGSTIDAPCVAPARTIVGVNEEERRSTS